jgi:hypothetical protein
MCSIIKEQVNLSEFLYDDDTNLISSVILHPYMIGPPKSIVLLETYNEKWVISF